MQPPLGSPALRGALAGVYQGCHVSLAIVCDICERFVVSRSDGKPFEGWERRWMEWGHGETAGKMIARWYDLGSTQGAEGGYHRCPLCARKEKEAGGDDLVERIRAVVREEIARLVPVTNDPVPNAAANASMWTHASESKTEEE